MGGAQIFYSEIAGMKSLFDNHWNRFKQVQYDADKLYSACAYNRLALAFPKGLEGAIFEQIPDISSCNYSFVQVGYIGLMPITDIGAVQARQAVIAAFVDDLNGGQRFREIFNNMHLINRIFRFGANYAGSHFSHLCLQRYQEEIDALVQELGRQDNPVLQKLAGHYGRRCPRKILNNVILASRQGGFDYIIMEMDPQGSKKDRSEKERRVRLHGCMKLPSANLKGEVVLGNHSAGRIGIDPRQIVASAVDQCMHWLNRIYAPLAALYTEAFYMRNNAVCLPEINKDGVFEMINGRPIMPTANPAGTDLYYDRKSAKVVLNGIHSGGKSYLLKTIAAYYLCALSGFPVPADSAKVPVVRRIIHSFDIEKRSSAGSFESECNARAEMLESLSEGDLVLVDEFLQHASPDAAADLEPIILDEFYRTGASVIVVTHRGESLDDKNKWQFYSPCFKEENGRIVPTYSFAKGRPDKNVLRRHARQMLEDALRSEPEKEKNQAEQTPRTAGVCHVGLLMDWHSMICKRLLRQSVDSTGPRRLIGNELRGDAPQEQGRAGQDGDACDKTGNTEEEYDDDIPF